MTTDTTQAGEEEEKWRGCVFFLVGNIPAQFRSADLRAVFSQFAEKEYFVCFHYRHRPEQLQPTQTDSTSSSSEATVITELKRDVGPAHFHSEASGGVAKTKCCVVAMERNGSGAKTFVQMYADKNWSTADGGFLRQKVRINELKVDFETTHQNSSSPNQGKIIIESLKCGCNAFFQICAIHLDVGKYS